MENNVAINIFEDLKQQLFDKSKWDKSTFKVFSYEAGIGKSRTTQEFLAEVEDRALYVQRFVKDGALDETVQRINDFAEEEVAVRIAEDEIKNKEARRKAINAKVLCITHQLYYSICRGNHQDLILNRKVLVIDEYPDLIEPITVSYQEIGLLWAMVYQYGYTETEEIASLFRDLMKEYTSKTQNNKEMIYINFREEKYDKYKEAIKKMLENMTQKNKRKYKDLLFTFQQILNNGCYFFQQGFHTINSTIDFVMLDCSIILDANAQLDYRYSLSKKFHVLKQQKIFDYSKAKFFHYDVNTSKKALKVYQNFTKNALEKINFEDCNGILFVTEKSQINKIREAIEKHFSKKLKEIQEILGYKISIDYFGNLIGKNSYRTYDTVVMLKTPIFDSTTYALNNFFFKYQEHLPIWDISFFEDEDMEKIRKTIIAGEVYQGLRRIARDNPGNAKMYVFNNNDEVINMVLDQMPGIQYNKIQIEIDKNRKKSGVKVKRKRERELHAERVNKVKTILLELKQSNVEYVQKGEIRKQIGVKDRGNFTIILNDLIPFLEANHIDKESNKQRLIFRR